MPPKKKGLKVTPFTLYMQQRKRQLTNEGMVFEGGWKDVAQHISDEWTGMEESDKNFWKVKAEEVNDREQATVAYQHEQLTKPSNSTCEKVFTQCDVEDPEETITKFFQRLKVPLEDLNVPVIHFNTYGQLYSHIFVPSEYGLGTFSLRNGIGDHSWDGSLIDPGKLPIEVSLVDVTDQMERTLVPRPPYYLQCFGHTYHSGLYSQEHFKEILQDIVKHSLLMEDSKTGRHKYILFTPYDSDIVNIRGCILWLLMKCDDNLDFEILKLSTFMKVMSFQKTGNDYRMLGIWEENNARHLLDDSLLNFTNHLGCQWHRREEKTFAMKFCSTNIVTRSIYLALGGLCAVYEIDRPIPTHAVDRNKKVEKITGENIVRKIEFQQRFGLVPIDRNTRKVLRRQFILGDFLTKLIQRYPEGLQKQPIDIVWPRSRDVAKDLNYCETSNIKITEPEGPPSDGEPEPETPTVLNW